MALHLWDLLDRRELDDHLRAGYVSAKRDGGLRVLNYTPSASYGCVWTPTTLTCRGLVVDDDDMIVARPFPKFFGVHETFAPDIPEGAELEVSEKFDGSLGIAFAHGGATRIATRGSLTSDQAAAGTKIWRKKYGDVSLPAGATPLFEIIYPDNRVVVNYGGRSDLVLLAVIDIDTGADLPLSCFDWPGPVAHPEPYGSIAEVIAAAETPARDKLWGVSEGFVVKFGPPGGGPGLTTRVKVKTADYLAAHKKRMGLSPRRVWAVAAAEDLASRGAERRHAFNRLRLKAEEESFASSCDPFGLDGMRRGLPEEFWPWFDSTSAAVGADFEAMLRRYRKIVLAADSESARAPAPDRDRVFAVTARRMAEGAGLKPGPCFGIRRGGWEARAEIWRAVRPPAAWTHPGAVADERI